MFYLLLVSISFFFVLVAETEEEPQPAALHVGILCNLQVDAAGFLKITAVTSFLWCWNNSRGCLGACIGASQCPCHWHLPGGIFTAYAFPVGKARCLCWAFQICCPSLMLRARGRSVGTLTSCGGWITLSLSVIVSVLSLEGFLLSFVNRVLEVKSKNEELALCCLRPYSSAEGCKGAPAQGNSPELWSSFCSHLSDSIFVHCFLEK